MSVRIRFLSRKSRINEISLIRYRQICSCSQIQHIAKCVYLWKENYLTSYEQNRTEPNLPCFLISLFQFKQLRSKKIFLFFFFFFSHFHWKFCCELLKLEKMTYPDTILAEMNSFERRRFRLGRRRRSFFESRRSGRTIIIKHPMILPYTSRHIGYKTLHQRSRHLLFTISLSDLELSRHTRQIFKALWR